MPVGYPVADCVAARLAIEIFHSRVQRRLDWHWCRCGSAGSQRRPDCQRRLRDPRQPQDFREPPSRS